MNIAIRVDASNIIGTGHVMRCLTLAQILRQYGHNISFSMRPHQNDFIQFVTGKGFLIKQLPTPQTWEKPIISNEYKAWLQCTEYEDAVDFIEKNQHTDLVIVDHYGLSLTWELAVKKQLDCDIFAIDDLQRIHHCDFLLDATLNRTRDDYAAKVPRTCKILTGCEYALLNPNFALARKN